MKTVVKGIIRNEKGYVLIAVLILLVVGGLILTPLLGLMSAGLLAGQVYEKKTDELYAADAGVEDAIWKIMYSDNISYPYHLAEYLTVNKKTVDYDIYREEMPESTKCRKVYSHQILSMATTDAGGGTVAIDSSTTVEAYIITVVESYGILDNVITSPCGYDIQGEQSQVNPPEGEEHGPVGDYTGAWPTTKMLSDLYWEDVKDEVPYSSGTLYVQDYGDGIGPLSKNGTLDIINTGSKDFTVALNGTLYITRDTSIGATAVGKNFTLDLNGQTIFVESASGAAPEDDPCNPEDNTYALKIGGGCTLTGSGCIIAVGNIEFKPNLSCTKDDYILVLSVSGKTYMQPNGDFYGTLAGSSEVYLQNGKATWTDYSTVVEDGLNFPDLPGIQQVSHSIESWEINPD
jgi:hypothetical protein